MDFRLTWYGHATLGLEVGPHHLLVDPYFSDNPAASARADEVPADYILITHGHNDHLGDALAIARRTGATLISNFEIAAWAEKQGLPSHGQYHGGHLWPFGYLKLTQALHGSSFPDGTYAGNPVGLLLTTPGGHKVYLAGDTGLFGDMRLIGEEGLDLAVLPIGDNYTMGPDDALRAVKLLAPRHVIPIHFDTWELIAQDAPAWARRVKQETGARAHVLQPGETFTLE